MRRILLLILVALPFFASAQERRKPLYPFTMYVESDCEVHALQTIIEGYGRINDTLPSLLAPDQKDIYILKAPYFKRMPDTFMGYRIHYINADSNTQYWYKKQQKEHIPIFYFSAMFNYIEFYYFFIIPVEMKKKKVTFTNPAYKLHYYFHQEHSWYTYTRAEAVTM